MKIEKTKPKKGVSELVIMLYSVYTDHCLTYCNIRIASRGKRADGKVTDMFR